MAGPSVLLRDCRVLGAAVLLVGLHGCTSAAEDMPTTGSPTRATGTAAPGSASGAPAERALATYPYQENSGSIAIGQSGRLVIEGDCAYLETDERYLLLWPEKLTRWEDAESIRYRDLVLRNGQNLTVRGASVRGVARADWPTNGISGCDYRFQQIVSGVNANP